VNTETTETTRGWVFYDADCRFCRGWAERTRNLLLRHGYHLVPLQAKWVQTRLNQMGSRSPVAENVSFQPPLNLQVAENVNFQPPVPLFSEMKLLTADGHLFGGADAVIRLTRVIWWAWPIYIFAQIPGIKPLIRTIYRSIARNRHCFGNHCQIPGPSAGHHRHLTSSFYEFP
jgi:predicted DCC family thiol-disulfide oxidoreductase YuxK